MSDYKSVPLEPTEEMLKAPNTIVEPYAARLIWQRMLEAAPRAPDTDGPNYIRMSQPGTADTDTELVERLRGAAKYSREYGQITNAPILDDAANAIAAQADEIARLKAELGGLRLAFDSANIGHISQMEEIAQLRADAEANRRDLKLVYALALSNDIGAIRGLALGNAEQGEGR